MTTPRTDLHKVRLVARGGNTRDFLCEHTPYYVSYRGVQFHRGPGGGIDRDGITWYFQVMGALIDDDETTGSHKPDMSTGVSVPPSQAEEDEAA